MRLITTLSTEFSLMLMGTLLLLHVISSGWNSRSLVTQHSTLMPNPLPRAGFVVQFALPTEMIPRVPKKGISQS